MGTFLSGVLKSIVFWTISAAITYGGCLMVANNMFEDQSSLGFWLWFFTGVVLIFTGGFGTGMNVIVFGLLAAACISDRDVTGAAGAAGAGIFVYLSGSTMMQIYGSFFTPKTKPVADPSLYERQL